MFKLFIFLISLTSVAYCQVGQHPPVGSGLVIQQELLKKFNSKYQINITKKEIRIIAIDANNNYINHSSFYSNGAKSLVPEINNADVIQFNTNHLFKFDPEINDLNEYMKLYSDQLDQLHKKLIDVEVSLFKYITLWTNAHSPKTCEERLFAKIEIISKIPFTEKYVGQTSGKSRIVDLGQCTKN